MPDPAFRNRRLPHWQLPGATYFVTFRLADSLPEPILQAIEFERRDIVRNAEQQRRALTIFEQKRLDDLFTDTVDRYLDAGSGACYLAQPPIALLVANALRYFDDKRYCLDTWCIMPNHVHVLFALAANESLEKVLHSWKSYTANQANEMLHREGHLWQRDYYNRLVRDAQELAAFREYILQNPIKAGLRDWEWVWRRSEGVPAL